MSLLWKLSLVCEGPPKIWIFFQIWMSLLHLNWLINWLLVMQVELISSIKFWYAKTSSRWYLPLLDVLRLLNFFSKGSRCPNEIVFLKHRLFKAIWSGLFVLGCLIFFQQIYLNAHPFQVNREMLRRVIVFLRVRSCRAREGRQFWGTNLMVVLKLFFFNIIRTAKITCAEKVNFRWRLRNSSGSS